MKRAGAGASDQMERLGRWYRGRLGPGQRTPLSLLVIQGTRFCNLDCRYCYLPLRSDKSRFDLALLDTLIPKLLDAGLIDSTLSVAWHAGEPLVLPVDYYQEAFDRFAALCGPDVRVEHHFQTNAVLLTDEYCRFIRDSSVRVGVSVDGPANVHDARRVTRSGAGSHARVMAGLERLRAHNISFSAIAVLTAESLDQPDALYEFFRDHGFQQVGFNVEEIEGANRSSSLSARSAEAYRTFLERVIARARGDGGRLDIREVRDATALLGAALTAQPAFSSEAEPFAILSVDVEGNVYTYSPEFIDVDGPNGLPLSFANVDDLDFATVYDDPRFRSIAEPIAQGVALCRATCAWYDTCGGGAPANKLAENGTFVSTETLHCRLTRQVLLDLVEEDVRARIDARLAARRRPRVARTAPAAPRRHTANAAPPRPLLDALPVLAADRLEGRLSISPGTMPAPDGQGFQPDALVARAEWRGLDCDELEILARRIVVGYPHGFVALVEMPEVIRPALEAVRAMLREEPAVSIPEPLAQRIGVSLGAPLASLRALGALRRSGGRAHTTVDPTDGSRLGLHVDSWSGQPADGRRAAGNRLCINIGMCPRALLFLPVPLHRIAAAMEAADPALAGRNPTEIGRAFMRRFPDFPVLRLAVGPGEAYVAPTEILVHDGHSALAAGDDCSLTVLGHFPRAAALRFAPAPASQLRSA